MNSLIKAVLLGNFLPFVSSIVYLYGNEAAYYYLAIDDSSRYSIPHLLIHIGTVVAQPLMVILIRTIGYRISIAISGTIHILSFILLLILSENTVMFATFFSGVSYGSAYITLTSYFAEISNAKGRPAYVMYPMGMFLFGQFITYQLKTFLSSVAIYIIFTVLTVVFVIFAIILLPESPYFLKHKKKNHLEQTISELKGDNCTGDDIQDIRNVLEHKKGNVKTICVIATLAIVSQFVGHKRMFALVQHYNNSIQIPIIICTFAVVLALFLSIYVKKSAILFISSVVTLILTIILIATNDATLGSESTIYSICLFFINFGLRFIPGLLLVEILPLNGMPLMFALISTSSMLMHTIDFILLSSFRYKQNEMFYVYSVMLALCTILIFFTPNTRGKKLGEIQKELCVVD